MMVAVVVVTILERFVLCVAGLLHLTKKVVTFHLHICQPAFIRKLFGSFFFFFFWLFFSLVFC